MTISPSSIRALADAYTLAELERMRVELAKELATAPDFISSASSGGGTTYSRTQTMTLSSRLELLERAISYKNGDSSALAVSHIHSVTISPLYS